MYCYTSKHAVSQLPGCLTGELPCITANDDGFLGEGCPADPTSAGPFKPKSVFALLAFAPKNRTYLKVLCGSKHLLSHPIVVLRNLVNKTYHHSALAQNSKKRTIYLYLSYLSSLLSVFLSHSQMVE